MDYLKFLLTTLIAALVISLDIYVQGAGIGMMVTLGGVIGYLIVNRPITHAAGFIIWLSLAVWWHFIVKTAVHIHTLAHPEKYTADYILLATGATMLFGMIVFHPVSYGLARFGKYLWDKSLTMRFRKDRNIS